MILVGTKSDKVNKEKSNLNDSWQKKCKDLMSRYPEVASTIECSAKLNFGVLDVFVSAQKVSLKDANCPKLNCPGFSKLQVGSKQSRARLNNQNRVRNCFK